MTTTHIDLSHNVRNDVIAILNARLADAIDLGIQAKMAHWNIRGPHFIALHELFDKVAEQVQGQVDELAERIGQLGGVVRANLQEVNKATSLESFSSDLSSHTEVLNALVKALASFTNSVRKDIDTTSDKGDTVTADLLTEISRDSDKYLWFLESHLKQ